MNLLEFQKNFQNTLNKEKKAFEKLSKPAKRVAIAKDVLEQIKLKRYLAYPGTYVEIEHTDEAVDLGICNIDDTEANFALQNDMITCKVCAKGALFMSHINKTDNCKVYDANTESSDTIVDGLQDIFDEEQLHLIEACFEQDEDFCERNNTNHSENTIERAVDLGNKHRDDDKRLIAICKNIIKNKGTFKP